MNSTLSVGGSMKINHRAVFLGFSACALASALVSCSEEPVTTVEREKLFTLSYGHFEDEIDLFRLDSDGSGPDTQIYMRDGMFYIANSGAKKILQFTSFGDLLSVYYNPDENPAPSFADGADGATGPAGAVDAVDAQAGQGTSTRKAVPYPFNHPVFLSVDSMKRLSVVDHLPAERVEYDNDDQVMLQDVVLRFNPDGKFLEYIGQDGPGGMPFPPIVGIYSNGRNELVVISKTQTGMKVYWFDDSGTLLFRIPVSYASLPGPYGADELVTSSLDKIVPDPDSRKLYFKIDYYVPITDADTGSNAGIDYERSCAYPFDISTGKYEARIDIPSYEGVEKDNLGTESFRKPYELLGITSSGWFYLVTPQEGGYALEVYDGGSKRSHKRILSVSDDELAYNALMLSPDGIVSALIATQTEASVVWWRTDSLIGEIRR